MLKWPLSVPRKIFTRIFNKQRMQAVDQEIKKLSNQFRIL